MGLLEVNHPLSNDRVPLISPSMIVNEIMNIHKHRTCHQNLQVKQVLISDNMKSHKQNHEDSSVGSDDEDGVDLVTTPLDYATYDYECMDPRVYSAKFSNFKNW